MAVSEFVDKTQGTRQDSSLRGLRSE